MNEREASGEEQTASGARADRSRRPSSDASTVDGRIAVRLRMLRGLALVAATAIPLVALVGWAADVPGLYTLGSSTTRMTPWTAVLILGVAFAAAAGPDGAANRSRWRSPAVATGVLALLSAIAALGIAGSYGYEPIRLNRLLFPARIDDVGISGWPAAQTSTAVVLLSLAYLVVVSPRTARSTRVIGSVLAVGAASIGLLGLFGYLTRLSEFYDDGDAGPGFALGTSICVVLLAAHGARVVVTPELRELRERRAWAGTLRILIPAAVLMPLLTAVTETMANSDGAHARFALSLVGVAGSVCIIALTWRLALLQLDSEEELLSLHDELRSAQHDAEAADIAKSRFLSRVSHELRTPLNAVLGFSQLLEVDDTVGEVHREQVRLIRESGERLLQLVDEIIEVSGIDSGEMRLDVTPTSLREVVAEPVELMRRVADDSGVSLVVAADLAGELGATPVAVDVRRSRQILLQLLSNAIKYNSAGGAVTVSCAAVPGQRLSVSVSDTGPGIAPERLGSVFEPFERVGAERTAVEGAGVGLTLARRLARAMGGDIEVQSALGHGSTFTLTMPRASAAPEPVPV